MNDEDDSNSDFARCVLKVLRQVDPLTTDLDLYSSFRRELEALVNVNLQATQVVPRLRGILGPDQLPLSELPKIVTEHIDRLTLGRYFAAATASRNWSSSAEDQEIWKRTLKLIWKPLREALHRVRLAGWRHGDLVEGNVIVRVNPVSVVEAALRREGSLPGSCEEHIPLLDFGSSSRVNDDADVFVEERDDSWDVVNDVWMDALMLESGFDW